jgi:hypothetical protein
MSYLDEVKEALGITEDDISKFKKDSKFKNNCKNYFYNSCDMHCSEQCKIKLHHTEECYITKECMQYQK